MEIQGNAYTVTIANEVNPRFRLHFLVHEARNEPEPVGSLEGKGWEKQEERERGKMGVGQGTRGGAKDVKQDARVEKRGGEGSEKLRTSCDGNKSSVLPCTSFRVRCTRIYPLQPPSTLYHVARTRHSSRPKWNFVLAPRSVDARICVSNVVFYPSLAIHPLRYPIHFSPITRNSLRSRRETRRSLSLCQPLMIIPL